MLMFVAPASAADIGSMKDQDTRGRAMVAPAVAIDAPSQSWTGIWAAALAGYSMSNTDLSLDMFGKGEDGPERANVAKLSGLGGEGFDATLQLGGDIQIGRLVLGGWGEYSFGGIETTASVFDGAGKLKIEQGDSYGAFGRIGVAMGDTLPYVAGGYVWTSFDSTLSIGDDSAKGSSDFSGPAAEIGVEHRFSPNIRGKLSGRYTFFDKETVASFGDADEGGRLTAEPGVLAVKAGIVISTTPGQGLLERR
jgi:opacity protein-like surface antigen